MVKLQQIYLQKIFSIEQDALQIVNQSKFLRTKHPVYLAKGDPITFDESYQSHAPNWTYLNHNLQVNLLQWLFSIGIRPELGICLEYMTWNKEQRLYMGFLRDLYSLLFAN